MLIRGNPQRQYTIIVLSVIKIVHNYTVTPSYILLNCKRAQTNELASVHLIRPCAYRSINTASLFEHNVGTRLSEQFVAIRRADIVGRIDLAA